MRRLDESLDVRRLLDLPKPEIDLRKIAISAGGNVQPSNVLTRQEDSTHGNRR